MVRIVGSHPTDPGSSPGRGKSYQLIIAALAQLGERETEDLKVPGSIPGGGMSIFLNTVSVAQWIRHTSPKGETAGSIPARDECGPLSSDGRAHDS